MQLNRGRRLRRAVIGVALGVVAAVAVPVAVVAASSSPTTEYTATPDVPTPAELGGTATADPTGDPATSTAATDPSSDAPTATATSTSTPSTAAAPVPAATSAAAGVPVPATLVQGGAAPAAVPVAPSVDAGLGDTTQDAVRLVSVLDRGAVGDGSTDDTAALQATFDAASTGDVVLLPAGRTFVQTAVLTIRNAGVTVTGGGTLLATRESASSLTVAAADVTLSGINLAIAGTSRRWDAYEQQRLRLAGATGAVIRDVVVDGSAAAGVYVGGGTSSFLLDAVTVRNTRADGIHITQGAHDGRVVSPVVRNVGDDGVAVVSYRQDGAPCARIQVVSPSVDGSTGGRGISVVGGTDVDYTGIDVRNTYGAGVYLAAEGGWGTTGVARVRVSGGTIVNANQATSIDHGSVLVYNGTGDQVVQDVTVSGLSISGYRGTVSRVLGLIADSGSSPGIRNATLTGIAIAGDGRPAALVSNQGATTFTVAAVTRNGGALVQTGGYFR